MDWLADHFDHAPEPGDYQYDDDERCYDCGEYCDANDMELVTVEPKIMLPGGVESPDEPYDVLVCPNCADKYGE